ncbi:MAG: WD40/YVTN/BNR-like repeat-containing protein, partial [Bacteroidia bacterium]
CFGQYQIQVLDSNTFNLGEGVVLSKTSFRGLSVVDDNTIWISGSRGTFARSTNGGKTFTYTQLKGYEKSDFRDIEAFDDQRAVMMSSGTPAYILKTTDGGLTWKEVYKNTDSAYFLDAMDFWDEQRGIMVGDPINGHFVLLETNNGGETWQELDTTKTPHAMEGEAVFAASGTSLRCWGKNEFGFVTGGKASRLINKRNNNIICNSIRFTQGKSSQGAFAFVVNKKDRIFFIIGGDYLKQIHFFDTIWNGKEYVSSEMQLHRTYNENYTIHCEYGEYKSGIDFINKNNVLACGTSGVFNYQLIKTKNSGKRIHKKSVAQKISSEPFHVVRKAKKGKAIFLAGPKGKIGRLVY